MLGLWQANAVAFAVAFAAISSLTFAVPFVIAPERWSRTMGWAVPEDRDLVRYFARSLGLLALSTNAMGLYAALCRIALLPAYYFALTLFFALMIPLHVYGALRRQQPVSETMEIALWAVLLVLAVLFYPIG